MMRFEQKTSDNTETHNAIEEPLSGSRSSSLKTKKSHHLSNLYKKNTNCPQQNKRYFEECFAEEKFDIT